MNDYLKIAYDVGATQAIADFEKDAISLAGIGQGFKAVAGGIKNLGTAANNASLGAMAKYPLLGDVANRMAGLNPAYMGTNAISALAAPVAGAVANAGVKGLARKIPNIRNIDVGDYAQNVAGLF